MKLIKLMLAIVMALAMVVAQDTGDNPCDPNMTYPAADPGPDGGCGNYADCNGNGAYDMGEPCFEGQGGPPTCSDVDTNGDGSIDLEEARAMYGFDDQGNPDPDFEQGYADVDTNDDGVVDCSEHDQANQEAMEEGQGPGTCDVCGHEYGGPDDHHGHCRVCDAEMNADEDWQSHCDENPDHCKAQAGDVCGFRGWDGQGEECGYVHTGDPDEDHHHCDHCGLAVNSGEEMHNHMQADHPDMMEQHDDGGGDHDGSQHYPNNHWDGNCGAMMNGESEYWLDSDGDPDNGPEDGPYAVWHEDADGNPVNCGPGPEGPPPTCEEVDANGDGSIDRDEARAKFGHDPQGNPDPNFDQRYDEVDANGDGVVDCGEHDAATAEGENNN